MNNMIDVDEILKQVVNEMHFTGRQIDRLRQCGYRHTFRRMGAKLFCIHSKQAFMPIDFQIDEICEVTLNDRSQYYIYALSHTVYNVRGIFTEYPPQEIKTE